MTTAAHRQADLYRRADEIRFDAERTRIEAGRLAKEAALLERSATGAEALAAPRLARFVVAEGRTLPTRGGLLGAFQDVRVQDLDDGELEMLVNDGTVVPRIRVTAGASRL